MGESGDAALSSSHEEQTEAASASLAGSSPSLSQLVTPPERKQSADMTSGSSSKLLSPQVAAKRHHGDIFEHGHWGDVGALARRADPKANAQLSVVAWHECNVKRATCPADKPHVHKDRASQLPKHTEIGHGGSWSWSGNKDISDKHQVECDAQRLKFSLLEWGGGRVRQARPLELSLGGLCGLDTHARAALSI